MMMASHDGAAGEADRETKQLSVLVGETFPLHLWEDRTRGELWVPSYDAGAVALISDDFCGPRATMLWIPVRGRSSFAHWCRANTGWCSKNGWAGSLRPRIDGSFW